MTTVSPSFHKDQCLGSYQGTKTALEELQNPLGRFKQHSRTKNLKIIQHKRRRKTAICNLRREASGETNLLAPQFQTSRFQNYEIIPFHHLSHSVCGHLLCQPQQTHTDVLPVHHLAFPFAFSWTTCLGLLTFLSLLVIFRTHFILPSSGSQ